MCYAGVRWGGSCRGGVGCGGFAKKSCESCQL